MSKRIPTILVIAIFIASMIHPTVGSTLSSDESYLYQQINEIRVNEGLDPLNINDLLVETAQNHSCEMATHDYSNHISPVDGSSPYDRVVRSGYYDEYYGMRMVSENIARTWPGVDVDTIVEAWMDSPGHRSNILSSFMNEIGVGIAVGTFSGLDNTAMYTAVFAYRAGTSNDTSIVTTTQTETSVSVASSLNSSTTFESTSYNSTSTITSTTSTIESKTSSPSTTNITTYTNQQSTQTTVTSIFTQLNFTTTTSELGFTTIETTFMKINFSTTDNQDSVEELQMITNSSITNLVIDQNERSIKFTIKGLNETKGFCNVTIPRSLLDGTPIILVDGNQVDAELREDSANYYAYFTYNHSSHEIEIYGSNTIPELHHVTITFSIAALTLCLLMRKHFTKKK